MSDTLDTACATAALRALRAGATCARDDDSLGMEATSAVLNQVIDEHGIDGVLALVLALAHVGGALIFDLTEAARLHVEGYMDAAILAEMNRQAKQEPAQ
jgi:hypothetical protein